MSWQDIPSLLDFFPLCNCEDYAHTAFDEHSPNKAVTHTQPDGQRLNKLANALEPI